MYTLTNYSILIFKYIDLLCHYKRIPGNSLIGIIGWYKVFENNLILGFATNYMISQVKYFIETIMNLVSVPR